MTVETQGMSAIVVHNVSGTHIQLNGVCTEKQEHSQLKKIKKTLVLVYESSYICIELSVADSCTNGIVILQGRYHNISNTIVANNKLYGIMSHATNSTRIMNCNVINNTKLGIVIVYSIYMHPPH